MTSSSKQSGCCESVTGDRRPPAPSTAGLERCMCSTKPFNAFQPASSSSISATGDWLSATGGGASAAGASAASAGCAAAATACLSRLALLEDPPLPAARGGAGTALPVPPPLPSAAAAAELALGATRDAAAPIAGLSTATTPADAKDVCCVARDAAPAAAALAALRRVRRSPLSCGSRVSSSEGFGFASGGCIADACVSNRPGTAAEAAVPGCADAEVAIAAGVDAGSSIDGAAILAASAEASTISIAPPDAAGSPEMCGMLPGCGTAVAAALLATGAPSLFSG